ncbi:MAG: adenylate/guanylate cyclase domain-containing protein [Pseudomonadota bacterium]
MAEVSNSIITQMMPFFHSPIATRLREEKLAAENRYLSDAIAQEKYQGHRIAVIARSIALVIVALMLPFLNPHLDVLYYEAFLLVFFILGWLQLRIARVGRSRAELGLILLDLILMAVVMLIPNPFRTEVMPTASQFQFEGFSYYYLFLAAATLAYSWRTVITMGLFTGIIWLSATFLVVQFGHTMPELSAQIEQVLSGQERIFVFFDPNDVNVPARVQEVVIFFLISAILALKSWRSNQLLIRQGLVAAERANLSRYFPPTLVDDLANRNEPIGPVRSQEVAILFADIVGFTHYAEDHTPEDVVKLLREFHAILEDCVFAYDGTLDKYLGDGIMATFGTPKSGPNDAINALKSATEMHRRVDIWNRDRAKEGLPTITLSIGINYGQVILGDIGTERRLEFAVLGDTVNVASRLESMTRQLECSIVVSDTLVSRIKSEDPDNSLIADMREQKGLKIRGRNEQVDISYL